MLIFRGSFFFFLFWQSKMCNQNQPKCVFRLLLIRVDEFVLKVVAPKKEPKENPFATRMFVLIQQRHEQSNANLQAPNSGCCSVLFCFCFRVVSRHHTYPRRCTAFAFISVLICVFAKKKKTKFINNLFSSCVWRGRFWCLFSTPGGLVLIRNEYNLWVDAMAAILC